MSKRETANYWGVECDCEAGWIALRPANSVGGKYTPHNFPEQFTVEGHKHAGAFHENEVKVRTLPYLPNNDLPKISPVKKPATTN
jgi:hypothetical protein